MSFSRAGVLAFGVLVGLLVGVFAVGELRSGAELDFHAYYVAGQAVLDGEPFVGWAITERSFLTDKAYVYPPITALLFVLYGLVPDWRVAYAVHGLVLLATFYALGRFAIGYIESQGRRLGQVDRWLILGTCLFSGPAVVGLYRGNVDPLVLLLLVVGFVAVERGRGAVGGGLWAIAAVFKLFPALLGVWLLYRRAYRAIGAALVVGVGVILLSLAAFGLDTNLDFVEFVLSDRNREGAFVGGVDPTRQWISLRRPLSYLLPLSATPLGLVGLAALGPFLGLMHQRAESELDQFGLVTATVIALLLTIIPSTAGYTVYLLVPLVVLVYLVEQPVAKAFLLAGLVLVNVPVYPQHIQQGLEALPLPGAVTGGASDLAWTVLTYGSVGLWGFLCAFVGCLLYICLPESGGVSRE